MSKVSVDARQKYQDGIKEYKKIIDDIQTREKMLLNVISKESSGSDFKRIRLADENLNLISYYVLLNELSINLLGVKNEGFLNDARKAVYQVIIYFEQIVTNLIDASWSEIEEKLNGIASFDYLQRWKILCKTGFALQSVVDAYGDNTKWKWSFVELEARFATIVKNFLNWKTLFQDTDLNAEGYDTKMAHLLLAQKLLEQSANRYREKYELSTMHADDFRTAIKYLESLRLLNLALNRGNEANNYAKKIEIWEQKLDNDLKKKSPFDR